MKHKSLLLVGAAAIVSGLLWVAAASLDGQDGKPCSWTVPRTPRGHPDLEGIWDSKNITPMERPAEATGREFLTDDEVAALERQAEARFSTAIENSAGITLGGDRAERGTTRDVAQAYSPVFISVGTRYVRTKRTSLVERFARVAPDMILYRVTIENPAMYTSAWTIEIPWTQGDGKKNQIFESACHEGNSGLTGILAGARALERETVRRSK
jgi:hypothetical protein